MTDQEQWVIGIHAVTELLSNQPQSVCRLLLSNRDDQKAQDILKLATALHIPVERVDRQTLDRRPGGNHQGVVAQIQSQSPEKDEKFLWDLLSGLGRDPFILVLEEISDPQNLGACLRTADAAGVDAVVYTRSNTAPVNATVRKVASGAVDTVNLVPVTNLNRVLKQLQHKSVWLVGTAGEATMSLYEQDLRGPLALVMGSEGRGLRRLTRETCDFLVAIPMAGQLRSVNVSVAAGIVLFEARRQRNS